MIYDSQDVARTFGYDFMYLDLILMAVWIAVLLLVRKNRLAFWVGLFGYGVYFLADYVIWYTVLGIRHIIGIDPLIFLLYFSVTYSMLQFSTVISVFSEKEVKWKVFWMAFLFLGWLAIGFASQLLPIDDRSITVWREMGTQRGKQIVMATVLYLTLIILAWKKKCDLNFKKVVLIFLLGVFIHFTMEATLMIPGIRPQNYEVFYFNSLFEFNTGTPALYLIWWFFKDKMAEIKLIPERFLKYKEKHEIFSKKNITSIIVVAIVVVEVIVLMAAIAAGGIMIAPLNISLKVASILLGVVLTIMYLDKFQKNQSYLKYLVLVVILSLNLFPFFWLLDDFFYHGPFNELRLGFATGLGMMDIILIGLVFVGYEVFIVSRGKSINKWKIFRYIYLIAICVIGVFVWFRFLRPNEKPDGVGWLIIVSYMSLLMIAILILSINAYRLARRIEKKKVKASILFIGHFVVATTVVIVIEVIDWQLFTFDDHSWVNSLVFAYLIVLQLMMYKGFIQPATA
ncbi:MAG: hypothetical protein ACFFCS_18655 [Candidatus Hodarchaeota archaeon]